MFKSNYLITAMLLLGLLVSCTNDSSFSSVENNSDDSSAIETVYASSVSSPNIRSVYTDINLDICEIIEIYEEGGWQKRCPGYNNISVYVKNINARYFVDVGSKNYISHPLLPYNYLGKKMEWRLRDGKPFAVIYRNHYSPHTPEGTPASFLAVNKIATKQEDGCVTAVIFASVPNANETARKYADERAASFKCGTDHYLDNINEI